jgi:Sec-independent protein translocase protein TatA
MSDEPENKPDGKPEEKATVKIVVEQAAGAVDKANTTMENASNVMSTIKWVAIAIVALVVFGGGYGIYKMIAAPAKAVGNAAESVTDAAKAGTDKVKDVTSDVINRLVVPATNQQKLDVAAERAFATLADMEPTKPAGVKDRMFRASKLGGNDGKVCELSIDFGNGAIPVFTAADNEEYATAKSLGAKDDRLMRIVFRLEDEELNFNTAWDEEAENWVMRWKATMVKKAIGDPAAERRILDVLTAIPKKC